ncbi:MAG: type II toxin-antitoxin system PemK/MazF family toxin [Acidimicrobiia bacterium]
MNDLSAGDVVLVDLGSPIGSEAGFVRPAVVVSASGLLRRNLATIFVVPCTSTFRNVASHVELAPDEQNGLPLACWAQVEQLRSIARARCVERLGNVGVVALVQIREIAALLIDIR